MCRSEGIPLARIKDLNSESKAAVTRVTVGIPARSSRMLSWLHHEEQPPQFAKPTMTPSTAPKRSW